MRQVIISSGIILMVLFIWACGDNLNSGNEILSLTVSDSLVEAGGSVLLVCTAVDEDGESLGYIWKSASGTLTPNGSKATWTAPLKHGIYLISCTVTDGYGATDVATIAIEVTPVPGIGVSGTVLNAVDRSPVANVLVIISGYTGTTNDNGDYTILNVGTGNHDAAGSSDGFCPFSAPFVIPDDYEGETFTYNFSMSPVLIAGQTRMVLNWGETPPDLDSHVLTPIIDGSTHHIYFSNPGSYITAPYAKLDTDDTDGYGPETITINQSFSGTYIYYIKNYSGVSDGLKNSGAVAQIYSGESCAATIIEVPTDTDGLYWYVCDIDGATGNITVVNQIQQDIVQKTYVPDDNFEQALIDLGYDGVLDDYVLTDNISGVTSLTVDGKEISDLTGIQDFTALELLYCETNLLTSLDVSNNLVLSQVHAMDNQLTSVDVSNNSALEVLNVAHSQLDSLDVSNNISLNTFDCYGNNLTYLNMKNGVTVGLTEFIARNNSLVCIETLDPDYATENWTHANGNIDDGVIFAIECP